MINFAQYSRWIGFKWGSWPHLIPRDWPEASARSGSCQAGAFFVRVLWRILNDGDKVTRRAKAWDGPSGAWQKKLRSLQLIEHLEARGELMLEIPQTLTLIERAFKRFKVSITGDD